MKTIHLMFLLTLAVLAGCTPADKPSESATSAEEGTVSEKRVNSEPRTGTGQQSSRETQADEDERPLIIFDGDETAKLKRLSQAELLEVMNAFTGRKTMEITTDSLSEGGDQALKQGLPCKCTEFPGFVLVKSDCKFERVVVPGCKGQACTRSCTKEVNGNKYTATYLGLCKGGFLDGGCECKTNAPTFIDCFDNTVVSGCDGPETMVVIQCNGICVYEATEDNEGFDVAYDFCDTRDHKQPAIKGTKPKKN